MVVVVILRKDGKERIKKRRIRKRILNLKINLIHIFQMFQMMYLHHILLLQGKNYKMDQVLDLFLGQVRVQVQVRPLYLRQVLDLLLFLLLVPVPGLVPGLVLVQKIQMVMIITVVAVVVVIVIVVAVVAVVAVVDQKIFNEKYLILIQIQILILILILVLIPFIPKIVHFH